MMSIKKTTETSYSFKQEMFRSFKKRKVELIGIILALLLVIFDFLAYKRSLYSIFMLVGITVYVLYYFLQSMFLYTRLRLALKVLEANPDFKEFQETITNLTPEQLEAFQKIQENELVKAKEKGYEVKSITED